MLVTHRLTAPVIIGVVSFVSVIRTIISLAVITTAMIRLVFVMTKSPLLRIEIWLIITAMVIGSRQLQLVVLIQSCSGLSSSLLHISAPGTGIVCP